MTSESVDQTMNKEKIFNLSKKEREENPQLEKSQQIEHTTHNGKINLNTQIIIYVNRLLIHTQSLSNFKNPFKNIKTF